MYKLLQVSELHPLGNDRITSVRPLRHGDYVFVMVGESILVVKGKSSSKLLGIDLLTHPIILGFSSYAVLPHRWKRSF